MKLSELFSGVADIEITSIVTDSRMATAGSLFFCLTGFQADGHAYAEQAYQNGCRAFVAMKPISLSDDAVVIYVENTHQSLTTVAPIFYGHPEKKLRIFAITGTKGKTTSALMAYHILNQSGLKAGYIGTVGIWYNTIRKPSVNTTPDILVLQETMRDMVQSGIQYLIMEVSSQAHKLGRIDGLTFESAYLTNLYPDHIGPGEHADYSEYVSCKRAILTQYGAKSIYCNSDQNEVKDLVKDLHVTFMGTCEPTDHMAQNPQMYLEAGQAGVSFTYAGIFFTVPVPGLFNVNNALIALSIGSSCGISLQDMQNSLSTFSAPGRMEMIPGKHDSLIVIDYAHNGASLESALSTLKAYHPRRLLCLFGSVGGRTQIRRRELGEVAGRLADYSILTADNPNYENPSDICLDIADAIEQVPSHSPYIAIPDREQAILYALKMMDKRDILLLAGKGHEDYQLIHGQHIPFCEKGIVLSYLSEQSKELK